jgi:hypothetical protein
MGGRLVCDRLPCRVIYRSLASLVTTTVRALNDARANDQKRVIDRLEVLLGSEVHLLEALPEDRRTDAVNKAISAAREYRSDSIARGAPPPPAQPRQGQ